MASLLSPDVGLKFESRYRCEALRFEEVRYAPDHWVPSHSHQEAYLVLCLQGNIEEFSNRQKLFIGPAMLSFLPIGAPHACRFTESVRTFQMVLNASWLERFRQVAPLTEEPAIYQNGLPSWIAARIYREFQQRDNLSSLVMQGMLLELLAEMSRHAVGPDETDCPHWLRQAKDYLHAHFTESISLEALASAVGVHPSHLMRSFRRHCRCTVGDYIRRLRVEYASHLLATSDASPTQIAMEVGFADQSHFNRTFKGFTSMTPIEFQKASGRASYRQKERI